MRRVVGDRAGDEQHHEHHHRQALHHARRDPGSSALPIIAQHTPARIVPAMKRPSQSFDSAAGGVVLMNAL